MIARLSGRLIQKSSTEIIVDCNGVGYLVFVSVNTSQVLPEAGNNVDLYTILVPREDSLNLYGFKDEQERDAFRMITAISGIGPKIALGILSSVSVPELQELIIGGNLPALTKLPGIGKKTAERLNLELKDKIAKLGPVEPAFAATAGSMIVQEAVSALVTLGYNKATAEKSIAKAVKDEPSAAENAEKLIRISLKYAMS